MQQRLGAGDIPPALSLDPESALQLAARLSDQSRFDFARRFSAAVALHCWRAFDITRPVPRQPIAAPAGQAALDQAARGAVPGIAAGLLSQPIAEVAYAVGSLYTMLLPEGYRARHGIFYTPPALVERLLDMAEEAGIDWRTARVLDPACGGGAFLVGLANRMARALEPADPKIALHSIGARLRGFDLDPFGAWLARAMLAIALDPLSQGAAYDMPDLVEVRDSLELAPTETASCDLVIGNPPYGRISLAPDRRRRFARSLYGHANHYGLFTEAALHWTKDGGVIAFVTPTSMLSGLYYKGLRELLAAEAPPLAVDFIGERQGIFAGVLQETMLASYRKGGKPVAGEVGFFDLAKNGGVARRKRAGSFTLPAVSHAPWLLPRSADQAELARRLRAMPHRLADYGYCVSTGPLVWNRHKDQFCAQAAPSAYPVIWAEAIGGDGRFLWRSEKRNHLPWFAANRPKDDWLIVTRPCVMVQRTTAKEQPRRLIAAELPQSFIHRHGGVVVENHLNMVRALAPAPPISTAAIAALLNSFPVDAAFRCINGSVAVSAFELEQLPLPPPRVMARLAHLAGKGAPPAQIEKLIASTYRHDAPAAD